MCVNEEGKVIGTFYFIQVKDIEPTYHIIEDGSWINGDSYGVVHRLASDEFLEDGIPRVQMILDL